MYASFSAGESGRTKGSFFWAYLPFSGWLLQAAALVTAHGHELAIALDGRQLLPTALRGNLHCQAPFNAPILNPRPENPFDVIVLHGSVPFLGLVESQEIVLCDYHVTLNLPHENLSLHFRA